MRPLRRDETFRWWYKKQIWFWLIILLGLNFIRINQGYLLADFYALISRPFWPSFAQKEWIENGINLENKIRLDLIQKDNDRLRKLLSLKGIYNDNRISASVIARNEKGFWNQLVLNKGSKHGIQPGNIVLAPGGLLGVIDGITLTTSKVRLLTSPGSKVGVWIERSKAHALLVGTSNNRPQLNFLDKNPEVKVGDVVSTSPASILLPPNLSVGVVQFIDLDHLPAPYALVQLLSHPESIDWVQVIISD